MISFKFEYEKAIASILFVTERLQNDKIRPDFHKVFNILYFADQKHIVKFGRPIIGDQYIAMSHGPVPSRIYDMFKILKGESTFEPEANLKHLFIVRGEHNIYPLRSPNLDELSETDIFCLNESTEENKDLNFNDLKEKSHKAAYKKAAKDNKMSYINIAKEAEAVPSIIDYMKNRIENDKAIPA